MAIVAGTREQGVFAIYLLRKQHSIAVEGKQSILTLVEGLEVLGKAYSNGGTMVAVASCNPILAVDIGYAWVILIVGVREMVAEGLEVDGVMLDVPMYAVL